jgi:hypothetical protein
VTSSMDSRLKYITDMQGHNRQMVCHKQDGVITNRLIAEIRTPHPLIPDEYGTRRGEGDMIWDMGYCERHWGKGLEEHRDQWKLQSHGALSDINELGDCSAN